MVSARVAVLAGAMVAAARAEEIWGEAMVAEVKEALHLSVRRHHLMGLLRVVVAETATVVVVKAEAAKGVSEKGVSEKVVMVTAAVVAAYVLATAVVKVVAETMEALHLSVRRHHLM